MSKREKRKYQFSVDGIRTSVRLDPTFSNMLTRVAVYKGVTRSKIVRDVWWAAKGAKLSFASALRAYLLDQAEEINR